MLEEGEIWRGGCFSAVVAEGGWIEMMIGGQPPSPQSGGCSAIGAASASTVTAASFSVDVPTSSRRFPREAPSLSHESGDEVRGFLLSAKCCSECSRSSSSSNVRKPKP